MLSKAKTVVLVVALLTSICLNVATVTVQAVALGVAGAVSMVAGATSVLPEFRTVTFRGQKKRLADAVGDTSKRIAKRSAVSASRNAGSVVAEAIPVAGLAVILGVTAFDLKDSCETLRDLHELDRALDPSTELAEQAKYVCGLKVPTKEEVWAKVKASPGEAWAKAKEALPDLPEMPKMPDMSEAWAKVKDTLPDLPEVPDLPEMPKVKWKFWE